MQAMILFHLKCFGMLVPTYNIKKSKKHLPYGKCEACTKTHFTIGFTNIIVLFVETPRKIYYSKVFDPSARIFISANNMY
jgi:hypothetical protein